MEAKESVAASVSQLFYQNGDFYDQFEAGAIGSSKQEEDIPFWIKIARSYGDPILELGCGTGRISIPLAEEGLDITGLDISETMLSTAQAKSSKVKWIQADASNFNLEKQFQLILFPYNALLHLETNELKSCLQAVKKHLSSNGRLAIDIANPYPEFLLKLFLIQDQELSSIFRDLSTNDTVVVTRKKEYNASHQIITLHRTYHFVKAGKEITEQFRARIYFPQEINTLISWSGFKVEQKFGDYDFSPFTSDSPQQLIVCQPN